MTFKEMNLHPMIIRAIEEREYMQPTPIQVQAIPSILKSRDLLGIASTGTGKTAAFAIPILQKAGLHGKNEGNLNKVKALILAPTRELAIQIGQSFDAYGKYMDLTTGVVFGGVTPKQHIKVMRREPDILVATPGRLLDLDERGVVDFSELEVLVLDEADRMLDLGMAKDVERILSKLPKERQNLLFSATMPDSVQKLTNKILNNPVRVHVKSKPTKQAKIHQKVYYVDPPDKTFLLIDLLKEGKMKSVLVFVKTKKQADKVCKAINVANIPNIRSRAIHGDKSQMERQKVMDMFKAKEIQVLVASDVAARGIDIDNLTHVVNMNIPNVPETYIHRIGRTGRAGKGGTAISFCSLDEKDELEAIERHQKYQIPVVKDHDYLPIKLALIRNRELYRQELPSSSVTKKKPTRSRVSNGRNQGRTSNGRNKGPSTSASHSKSGGQGKVSNQGKNKSKNNSRNKSGNRKSK